jgi:hypothetical protein
MNASARTPLENPDSSDVAAEIAAGQGISLSAAARRIPSERSGSHANPRRPISASPDKSCHASRVLDSKHSGAAG